MNPHIYLITDLVTGMRNVGQHNGKRRSYFTGSTIVNRIVKKYGKKRFKKEIIVEGNFNQELINELEKHYIRLYATRAPFGYNLTDGGDIPSAEAIAKMRDACPCKQGHTPWNKGLTGIKTGWEVGVKRPKSLGEKVSKTKKEKYASGETVAWNKGRKCTEEEKIAIRKINPNKKGVAQYTKDGVFVKNWESFNEIERVLGINSDNISKRANGKVNWFVGGFDWKLL